MGTSGGCGSPPKHKKRRKGPGAFISPVLPLPCSVIERGLCLFPGHGPTLSLGSLGLAGQRTWGAVLGQSCFFVQDFTYH